MKWRWIIIAGVFLGVGFVLGYAVRSTISQKEAKHSYVQRREGLNRHINPLLECDIADNVLRNTELIPFRDKIADFLDNRMDKRWASSVSVYFRELNDGMWFSISESEKFIPASLRKVPLMIAILKQAERHKETKLLERLVTFDLTSDYNAAQNIKPSHSLQPGEKYRVDDLITRMIIYSDNNAFTLLTKIVDAAELDYVYATLSIQNPRSLKDDDYLSVHTYASFFRVLYNATYLSKEASEWALNLLTKTEFKAGIDSGVPPGIEVAQKFGEKSDSSTGTVQLHDCGIVYYPKHPYLICIMSKGPNFEFLDNAIVEISRMVFAAVDEQHSRH
jgi:beta-lactamase class A